MLQSNKLISNYREPALFDWGELVVAKERNTQINQRRWGGAGSGVEWWGLYRWGEEGCRHPSRERGEEWSEDRRGSGVGSWNGGRWAGQRVPGAAGSWGGSHSRLARPTGRCVWGWRVFAAVRHLRAHHRGARAGEPTGLQGSGDQRLLSPPRTPPTRAHSLQPQPPPKREPTSVQPPGTRGVTKVSPGGWAAVTWLGEAGSTPLAAAAVRLAEERRSTKTRRRWRRRRREPPYSFGGNSRSPCLHWLKKGVGRGCESLGKRR